MHFYLSSYRIGDKAEELKQLFSANRAVGYIPNAFDFSGADPKQVQEHNDANISLLQELGLEPVALDLKEYFGKKAALEQVMRTLGGVWVSGGNVFVLRQAMKLSGFDELLIGMKDHSDFTYGGYSAAGCVLSETLDAYQIVDDATDLPYSQCREQVWDGLGLIDFIFLPHFDSDHPESSDITKEMQYCTDHQLPYKTLRDGEVMIFR